MPSPVISHVLRIQAFDLGAISSVFLSAASGASPPTRLTLGTGAATNPCWESDGAGGWQAVKGDISGFSQVTADHFIANSFRLTSAADYTVTNPTTNRSLDVSAATLAQLREVVGTMIGDLVAAGFYQ
jgi:hypothetical protein